MKTLRKKAIAASLALGLSAGIAQAETYTLTGGGLTDITSSTFGPGAIALNPNPTGFDFGALELSIDSGTGDVSLLSGDVIGLSDFQVTITATGFGVTTVDAQNATLTVNNGATGNLGGGLSVSLTSSGTAPSITTAASYQNCSGDACILIPLLDLNLAFYTLNLDFASDFSSFTGELLGTTANNSTMSIALAGQVAPIPVPAAAWLFGSALLGLTGVGRARRTTGTRS